jgi:hypothetical protein
MWAALHVVKAVVSVAGGSWSDRSRRRRAVIVSGWVVYAVVYAGFADQRQPAGAGRMVPVYGFYFGFAEGTEKSAGRRFSLRRIGVASRLASTTPCKGLGSLAASVVFGLVWKWVRRRAAFGLGAALALRPARVLFAAVPSEPT